MKVRVEVRAARMRTPAAAEAGQSVIKWHATESRVRREGGGNVSHAGDKVNVSWVQSPMLNGRKTRRVSVELDLSLGRRRSSHVSGGHRR